MAAQSGWDTIFAEPIRWSRNQTVKKCWDHIKYTMLAAVSIVGFLWFTQGHRYLYNVMYGPFVLTEQEIVDSRPENLWKQYVQVHHGRPVEITTKDILCEGRPCRATLVQFKKRAAHNSNINTLLVKKPKSLKHDSYSKRLPINFNAMTQSWKDSCDVVLSSGQLRTLKMSPDQAGHMRNVLSSRSARFRQLEEERQERRQQEEEERLRRQKEEEENRKKDEAEQEARRRRQQEETIRRINEFLARLAERADERPASEEVVEEMRDSAFQLKTDSEENCVICQDGMKKGEMVIPFPCPAKHQFHEDCMLQFLEHGSSCPLCRHQVGHDTVDEHAVLDILHLLFT
ncbi:Hypp3048 [Branchiostoma lanceolatum]|uniref:Hypp3048 protein n=1 Tax=Branchiostoma lanceolatum TaxID=7740 RepID=A0A8K0ESI4_BRALA|nr:Hypp3048 [Branchiostoma lanceolatum]